MSEPLNNLTLNELYDRARLGDEAAESAMFDLLAVRFRLLARRYVGEEIAPDVGQEACLVVLRKYRTEQIQKTFEAWCQGVIKMTARSYLQKNRKQLDREKSLSEHQEPATGPRDGGLSEALRNCLKDVLKASRVYARVLNLSYQGFKSDEICSRLQISHNHYYVSLSRARARLKHCLEARGQRV